MKILIINGSPREKSYTKVLAKFVFEYSKEKYEKTEFLDLSKEELERFIGYEGNYNGKTKEILELMKKSDVYIICSPVYDGALSSAIKNLFEHINHKEINGKVAGFVIMAGGKISYLQVQGQLTALMAYFKVFSNLEAVHVGRESFTDEMILEDKTIEERLRNMVDKTIKIKSVLPET